jgi:hypothetical protein
MKPAENFSVAESNFVENSSRVFNTTAENLDTAAARGAMLTLAGTDILDRLLVILTGISILLLSSVRVCATLLMNSVASVKSMRQYPSMLTMKS